MRAKVGSLGRSRISKLLGAWYDANARRLPWRSTRDPYAILVSEIMLQQTRVAAVIPYYEAFLSKFPTIEHLASASEGVLLTAWSGLGYYSRARNLQKAAKMIVEAGAFPKSYDQIRELSGVGDYTAAAVGSIAFGLPHAAVDGNVIRVTSRLSAEQGDVGSSVVRQRLSEMADQLLDRRNPGRHNQAMMELGATICLPRDPKCGECPVEMSCKARAEGLERQLPLKQKKTLMLRVERRLLLVAKKGKILLWQRPASSKKMANFWELPEAGMLPGAVEGERLGEFRHSITNHLYRFELVRASLREIPKGFLLINCNDLALMPLSTTTRKALEHLTLETL